MPYYLAPYIGAGTRPDPFRPRGSSQPRWSAIDLRPDSSQITGRCLLFLPVHDPYPTLERLADTPQEFLGDSIRNRLQNALSLTLGQTRFDHMVEELLTLHARLDGTRWKPLRPGVNSLMRIYLGGPLSQWRPGSVGAAISENWNCANSASLTCQLTWGEAATANSGISWGITGNRAEMQAVEALIEWARAESDLATDDHFCQATMAAFTTQNAACSVGPSVRTAGGSDPNCYFYRAEADVGLLQTQLWKRVTANFTSLGTDATDPAVNDVLRVEADGSTVTGKTNGTTRITVTDTSVTSNLRCGVIGDLQTAGQVIALDGWSAEDLAAAAAALAFQERLIGRRIGYGIFR